MLMDHHKNRMMKIMKIKSIEQRVFQIQSLIERYRRSCFLDDMDSSQYDFDLLSIKVLIRDNKKAY